MHPPLVPYCLENSEFDRVISDIIRAIPEVCPVVKLFSFFSSELFSSLILSRLKDASIRKIVPKFVTTLFVKVDD